MVGDGEFFSLERTRVARGHRHELKEPADAELLELGKLSDELASWVGGVPESVDRPDLQSESHEASPSQLLNDAIASAVDSSRLQAIS